MCVPKSVCSFVHTHIAFLTHSLQGDHHHHLLYVPLLLDVLHVYCIAFLRALVFFFVTSGLSPHKMASIHSLDHLPDQPTNGIFLGCCGRFLFVVVVASRRVTRCWRGERRRRRGAAFRKANAINLPRPRISCANGFSQSWPSLEC